MTWIGTYILDADGNPQPAETIPWAQWFETSMPQRRVAHDAVGPFRVSTVFTAIDQDFFVDADPMIYRPTLWETMVLRPDPSESDGVVWELHARYRSKEDALRGHQAALGMITEEYAQLSKWEGQVHG